MTTSTPGAPREMTSEAFTRFGAGHLPALVGVEILSIGEGGVESRMAVRREVMARKW